MSATMVQRKVKHATTGDIYALGYAIIIQMATKDMDKKYFRINLNSLRTLIQLKRWLSLRS